MGATHVTRAEIFRVNWTVTPDQEPDAKLNSYAQECDVCGVASPRTHDANDGTLWIIEHARRNPSHTSYTEVVKRPWRAFMS
ncbi:DUF7848 domain-containing protein [Streptomyces daliensis]